MLYLPEEEDLCERVLRLDDYGKYHGGYEGEAAYPEDDGENVYYVHRLKEHGVTSRSFRERFGSPREPACLQSMVGGVVSGVTLPFTMIWSEWSRWAEFGQSERSFLPPPSFASRPSFLERPSLPLGHTLRAHGHALAKKKIVLNEEMS